jgi:glycosyltransferase involved in cell wall biosynthesis
LAASVEPFPVTDSLLQFYRAIDVGVLPSLWEGLPYALLEAMALGLPVIGSRIPGIVEVLGDVSPELLFTPGSAAELLTKMQWCVETKDSVRKAIGERGRQLVVAKHDFGTWQQSLRSVYRSVASRPGGSDAR